MLSVLAFVESQADGLATVWTFRTAYVTGFFAFLVALVRTRAQVREAVGDDSPVMASLTRIETRLNRVEDKIDLHINDHARGEFR